MRRLNGIIVFRGKGLHSGADCTVILEPCETPEVIISAGGAEYPLRMLKSDGTKRGSDYIFPNGERIRTCEHVFSALCGTGIYSGIKITVDGGEMPALDGCAREAGAEILRNSYDDGKEIPAYEVKEPLTVSSEDGMRFVSIFPDDTFHITYAVEYEYIGAQIFDYVPGAAVYENEIAPARTFAMKSEIEYLRSHGMALGGSLKNAVIVGEKIEAENGLRWKNEFVRHKVLDIIGDMYSLCRPLKGHITAVRAGHELHLRLAEKLKGAMKIA